MKSSIQVSVTVVTRIYVNRRTVCLNVTGQLADTPTRGLDKSRTGVTGQLAVSQIRPAVAAVLIVLIMYDRLHGHKIQLTMSLAYVYVHTQENTNKWPKRKLSTQSRRWHPRVV